MRCQQVYASEPGADGAAGEMEHGREGSTEGDRRQPPSVGGETGRGAEPAAR